MNAETHPISSLVTAVLRYFSKIQSVLHLLKSAQILFSDLFITYYYQVLSPDCLKGALLL